MSISSWMARVGQSAGGARAVIGMMACVGVIGGCGSGGGGGAAKVKENGGEALRGTSAGVVSASERVLTELEVAALRERALALLVEEAGSGRPESRINAIEALQTVPGRVGPLIALAARDGNVAVRSVAAVAVGRARLSECVEAIRPLTMDEDLRVRASALFALHRNGERVDLTPIGGLLRHSSPLVRAHGAFLLGELGDSSALAMLREAASDGMDRAPAGQVRVMRLQIAEAMVKLGEESALHEIRAALYPSRPEDLEGTALAAQIIGEVRDHGASDQLVYLTARREGGRMMPAEVRLAAAGALGKLGLSEGGFIGEEFRGNPNATVRAQAAYVFGQTGLTEHLSALESMLEDASVAVRVSAAAGIVRIAERQPSGYSEAGR